MSDFSSVSSSSSSASLRVGRIPFLVCAPYFHASLGGWPGACFSAGPPRLLNRLLAAGDLDAAPSSSFEYARHFERYLLLPGLCTSGRGEVKSVRFLSQRPWEALHGEPVALAAASDTSNAVFQVLSRFRFGVTPKLGEEGDGAPVTGRVCIGDAALRAASGDWPFRYDLAEVWETWQGTRLPFGLWMVRLEAWRAARSRVRAYHAHLRQSLADFFVDPAAALAVWDRVHPLPLRLPEALDFFSTTDYAFGPLQERALHTFFALAREANLFSAVPPLRFAEV